MNPKTLTAHVEALGMTLPEAPKPAANYIPWVLSRNTLYISGQTPRGPVEKEFTGKLGKEFNIAQGQDIARMCMLNVLAQLRDAIDDDATRIGRCIRLGGFVNSSPDFGDHPLVINSASDLLVQVLGPLGKHARTAVGVAALPRNVAVEIDAIFELV